MLFYTILCYLYLILFHVILSNTCSKNQKNVSLDVQKTPRPSQNLSKSIPNRIQEASCRLLGPPWGKTCFSPPPMGKKVPQETPRRSQPPPKTFPKPFPNPPKIHWKLQAKKTMFLESFFSWFFSIFTSENTYFSMNLYYVLAFKFTSKSMAFLSYFRNLFSSSAKNAIL